MSSEAILITSLMMFVLSVAGIVAFLTWKPRQEEGQSSASRSQTRSRTGYGLSRGSTTSSSRSTGDVASRLVQAGIYRRNSTRYYVVVKVISALISVGLGVALASAGMMTIFQGVAMGGLLGIIGTIVPGFWLDARKRSRQTQIRRALPDALDVIVVCLEAGLSLRAALSRVAKELSGAHPMLAAELLIAEREIQLGQPAGQALHSFAERFDLEELRSLSSVVKQAEAFGASVARALRVHAESLRVKRFQMAEERAQKANVKLLFPTMFLIFPTLYVILLGPAVVDILGFFSTFGRPQ